VSGLKPTDDGWVGHDWKMRGFHSDECIHCGVVAVEGINGMTLNIEHCQVRADKQAAQKKMSERPTPEINKFPMNTTTEIPKDSPLMLEWENYKDSDEYQNSFRWAAQEEHRDGSMWAAFMAGFLPASMDAQHLADQLNAAREQAERLAETVASRDADRAYNDQKWNELRKERDEARKQAERLAKSLREALIQVYTIGYHRGHQDTVEGFFTYVHPKDSSTFFADDVDEIVADDIIGFADLRDAYNRGKEAK
jgi:hypothetical protein